MRNASKTTSLLALVVAATLVCGVASAEPAGASNPLRAAGWTVIGIGTALGLGTAATGVTMMANYPTEAEMQVGTASLVGGLATAIVALAIGIPLLYSGSSSTASTQSNRRDVAVKPLGDEVIAQALAGQIRF